MIEGMISIIIPCYNCEKTVENTLKSVESQTYHNIEVILIDDGSQDRTLSKLYEYKKNSSRKVVVIHQENGGVSLARNKGLELANGQYISFIDADDTYINDALQLMYNGYSSPDVDVVYAFFTRVQSQIQNGIKPREEKDIYKTDSIENTMYVLMNEKYRLGFYTFLFKKSIIQSHKVDFPVGLKTGEDLEFLWKYLIYCSHSVEVNRYIYYYYNNPTSAVHKVEWSRTQSYNSILKIRNMMIEANCNFADAFFQYMGARYLWSYAKTFSIGNRKDLFLKLSREYPVKDAMKTLLKICPDIRVRSTAALYLVNKHVFYYAVGVIGRKYGNINWFIIFKHRTGFSISKKK